MLDASGQPSVRWWPVAYAFQRIDDKRALTALLTLAKESHPYTRAFAAKGLGGLKRRLGRPDAARAARERRAGRSSIESVRALGRIGDAAAAPALLKLIQAKDTDAACAARGGGGAGRHARSGRLRSAARFVDRSESGDPCGGAADPPPRSIRNSSWRFFPGSIPIPIWSVRAALASVLGTLPPEIALPRLTAMLEDSDQRVIPAVLDSARQASRAQRDGRSCSQRLKAEDPAVRAAAATGLGEIKPPNGEQALAEAYQFGQRDPRIRRERRRSPRSSKYGAAAATPVLRTALADKDWAVRLRAAMLLKELDPSASADVDAQIRPAPTTADACHVSGGASREPACLDGRVPRHRSRDDRDRAGGARRAADRRELRDARAEGILRRPERPPRGARLRRSRPAIRAATAKAGPATRSATSSTSARTCAAPSAWRSTSGATPAAASSSSRTHRSRTSTRSTRSSAA